MGKAAGSEDLAFSVGVGRLRRVSSHSSSHSIESKKDPVSDFERQQMEDALLAALG